MKYKKILFFLILISLSNCITNLNYSSEIRKQMQNLEKKHKNDLNYRKDRSFMETNVKTSSTSEERAEMNNKIEAKTETKIKSGSSSTEKLGVENKAEATTERRSKVKKKIHSSKFLRKTATKSKTKTKLFQLVFTAILGTMFIAKTVFTYVESHYHKKTLDVIEGQIKQMKDDTYYLKKNEIEACTLSTLMLLSNKHIILVYKLRLIFIRAYTISHDNYIPHFIFKKFYIILYKLHIYV